MKKRILYIGNALSRRGTTKTTIESLGGLLEQEGYSVRITSSITNKPLRMLDMIWTTIHQSNKVDVVLIDTYSTTNFWYAVVIGGLCQLLNKPYIPILHGGDLPNRIKKNLKTARFLFDKAIANVAPSNYLISAFKKERFTNLTYIPNAIALKNYTYLKRESLRPKLLWVRSFSKIYNPLMALKVLEELKQEYPEATLTMVGPDKDGSLERCKAFAKENELPVTFTGLLAKEEWIALAASHDIFINTTNFDNTPVSVIEAMALGLPVVSTDVGGMPFLITHDKDGVLSPKNDVLLFVSSISKLLKEPGFALSITQNARKKAESFDWDTVKKRWEEVLS